MIQGAVYQGQGLCSFKVFAPFRENVELKIIRPDPQVIALKKDNSGYWSTLVKNIYPGTEYMYVLDREILRPDPCSNYQAGDVHGPSLLVDHNAFNWQDADWQGIRQEDLVFYELHVGTFTAQGTFRAIIPRLSKLCQLGITALNIMPVAQFPGKRNWGYDGVLPYAVQNSYGGPNALKSLVNACHGQGLSVFLDVVYNHLGPEGNYLRDFGPYFTDRYKTPWGEALNFDGPYSDQVRDYFIQNALYWFDIFHFDGLRLDAVHAIYDQSAVPFLQELAERVDAYAAKTNKSCMLIAESDLNDSRLIRDRKQGGYGLKAQWSDDFHHALHTLLTRENKGYYQDFGQLKDLATAYKQAYVYSRRYSGFRRHTHGNSAQDLPGSKFVVCSQNHDQVGNRMLGERLSRLVSFEALKLAAATVIHSPYLPLLFMGEEYGENAPFLYFVNHTDPELVEAVRQGRKQEFASFAWQGEPPDPQDQTTFEQSRIDWEKQNSGKQRKLLQLYTELLNLRSKLPMLGFAESLQAIVYQKADTLLIHRKRRAEETLSLLCFKENDSPNITLPPGSWNKVLDTAEQKWLGPGSFIPDKPETKTQIKINPLSYTLFKN